MHSFRVLKNRDKHWRYHELLLNWHTRIHRIRSRGEVNQWTPDGFWYCVNYMGIIMIWVWTYCGFAHNFLIYYVTLCGVIVMWCDVM